MQNNDYVFFETTIMKKIFYAMLGCCMMTLGMTGCSEDTAAKKTTLVAIRPAKGTAGTEVTLYGEGFGSTPDQNVISLYGENAEITEVAPNDYIKFIAPENPLGSYPVMLTIGDKTYTGSKFTYADLNSKINVSTLTGGSGQGAAVGDKNATKFVNPTSISWIEKGKTLLVADRALYPNSHPSFVIADMAGNTQYLFKSSKATEDLFKAPWRTTIHDGKVYVAEKWIGQVCTIDLATKEVKVLCKTAANPLDVKFDKAGNMYVLCRAGNDGIFRAEAGDLATLKPWVNFESMGIAQVHAMDFDGEGNLIVTSNSHGRIYMVTPDKQVTLIAGSELGDSDGVSGDPQTAKFNQMYGVAVASDGTVYVIDGNDGNIPSPQKVKRVTKGKNGYADGSVTTLVGQGGGSIIDGAVDEARFGNMYDICLDEDNRALYVIDRTNYAVRKIEY